MECGCAKDRALRFRGGVLRTMLYADFREFPFHALG